MFIIISIMNAAYFNVVIKEEEQEWIKYYKIK